MPIKLIASDMDDTLLNNNREISARNEAAIKKAIAEGIVYACFRAHVLLYAAICAKTWP